MNHLTPLSTVQKDSESDSESGQETTMVEKKACQLLGYIEHKSNLEISDLLLPITHREVAHSCLPEVDMLAWDGKIFILS